MLSAQWPAASPWVTAVGGTQSGGVETKITGNGAAAIKLPDGAVLRLTSDETAFAASELWPLEGQAHRSQSEIWNGQSWRWKATADADWVELLMKVGSRALETDELTVAHGDEGGNGTLTINGRSYRLTVNLTPRGAVHAHEWRQIPHNTSAWLRTPFTVNSCTDGVVAARPGSHLVSSASRTTDETTESQFSASFRLKLELPGGAVLEGWGRYACMVAVETEEVWPDSGGGFSLHWPQPSWQRAAVEHWLTTAAGRAGEPDPSRYRAFAGGSKVGRGFPDIVAQAVVSTDSCNARTCATCLCQQHASRRFIEC